VRAYEALVDTYFEPGRALLSLLPLAMRMAGPREALLHALIRRNYGATHFIVGRDHAGPGNDTAGRPFYPPYAAQELVSQHEDELGIRMMAFHEMVYLPDEDRYEEENRLPPTARTLRISGTQVRQDYLAQGRPLPGWFTRPEVARILAEAYTRRGACIWFTGLSASGKSTTAEILAVRLLEHGRQVTVLDGDVVRTHLSSGLGFSKADRDTHIRRLGFVASEIVRHGGIVICAAISPYAAVRADVRHLVGDSFIEVFMDTPLALCEQRDPKGLYAKARRGEITGFTGIDDPYEPPVSPEICLTTEAVSAEENAQQVFAYLLAQGYLRQAESATE
jgi:sulfate adenylyltransferase